MSQPSSIEKTVNLLQPELAAVICCARCSQVITQKKYELAVDGSHERTFRNPAGYSFYVLCFREAPGCHVQGPSTTEASWFRGAAWSFAFCQACGQHLGWCYTRPTEAAFYGLIAPRLLGWK